MPCVLHFRRHIPPDMLDLTLGPAAIVSAKKRKPGPGGVLLTRLEQICWTYVQEGQFQDGEGGRLHILHTPPGNAVEAVSFLAPHGRT